MRCNIKVFSIVFHDKNGLILSTDRHNDCWIRLSGKNYGRLTKVRDHSEFIKIGSMMKLVELRQESEINPNLIVSIPNVFVASTGGCFNLPRYVAFSSGVKGDLLIISSSLSNVSL